MNPWGDRSDGDIVIEYKLKLWYSSPSVQVRRCITWTHYMDYGHTIGLKSGCITITQALVIKLLGENRRGKIVRIALQSKPWTLLKMLIINAFTVHFCPLLNLDNLLFILFQFPGGSDNFLPISGEGHPFLSSSEVPLHSTYSLQIQDAEVLLRTERFTSSCPFHCLPCPHVRPGTKARIWHLWICFKLCWLTGYTRTHTIYLFIYVYTLWKALSCIFSCY